MKTHFAKHASDEESLKTLSVWTDYPLFGELHISVFIKFASICSGYTALRCHNSYFKNDIGSVESYEAVLWKVFDMNIKVRG